MNAIEARDVRKRYRRYGPRKNFGTLKSALLSGRMLQEMRPDQVFEALKGVSFDVRAGRTFGVIGRNGSGKSTLLKLIAGIGKPTSGSIHVNGRVSALIELGAGFHPEITGRENVYINGMMLGLSRREVASRFDEIVRFAEMEDFIDTPVKNYSSGLYARLGFAVAIHVDPDVMLVDEVLAVGDETYTHRCLDKFAEFRRQGRTVLLVTHSLDLVSRFCDEALWLDAGAVKAQGDPKRVIDAYLLDIDAAADRELALFEQGRTGEVVAESPAEGPAEPAPPDPSTIAEGRWGSREAEITAVELRHADGLPGHVFQSGEAVTIHLDVRAHQPLRDFVFGVGIFNAEGICCYGTNTLIEGAQPEELTGDAGVDFRIGSLALVEGTYKLDVAVHRENGAPYDYHRQQYTFRVTSRTKDVGVFRPPHQWTFSGGVRITGL